MTCYNHQPYLEEALDSVGGQTYPNWELILVDDGSTDGSPGIAHAFLARCENNRFHFLQKPNAGQASALNAGYAHCHGEIIALMDGDDIWQPTKLEEMMKFIERNPGAGIYQHNVENGQGQVYRKILPTGDIFSIWRDIGTVNFRIFPHYVQVNVPTCGLLLAKSVADAIMPIPEELVVCPDYYIFIIACSLGPLYSYPKPLGTWRDHGTNASKQYKFSFRQFWIPCLLPRVNEELERRGHAVQFTFNRWALFLEPFRLVAQSRKKRRKRKNGLRVD